MVNIMQMQILEVEPFSDAVYLIYTYIQSPTYGQSILSAQIAGVYSPAVMEEKVLMFCDIYGVFPWLPWAPVSIYYTLVLHIN